MTADTTTSLLGFLLQGTGNNNNSWGQNLNDQVIQLAEDAIAGQAVLTTLGGTYTLNAAEARASTIILANTLTSDLTIVVPDTAKIYRILNYNAANVFFTLLKCTTQANKVSVPRRKVTEILVLSGFPYRFDESDVGRYVYDASGVSSDALECDGTLYKRATFPDLFLKIGTTYGTSDSTDFRVPNAYDTGRFLRSRTASVALATSQSSQNKSHTHTGGGTTLGASVSMSHTHAGGGTTAIQSAGHTHGFTSGGMNSNVSHTHTGGGTTGAQSADHTHGVSGTSDSGGVNHTHTGSGTSQGQSADHTHGGTSDAPNVSLAHSHSYGGTTAGVSAAHTHTSAVPQQGNAGTGSPITTAFSEGANNKSVTALNVTSGSQSADHTHTYSGTTADSGALSHTHTFTTAGVSAGHTHEYSFTTSVASAYSHTHTFSATSGNVSADHTHSYSFTTNSTSIDHTHGGTTGAQSVDHTHTYSFTTAATDLAHTHTYSFTTSTGSADGTEARPESLVGILCIRY